MKNIKISHNHSNRTRIMSIANTGKNNTHTHTYIVYNVCVFQNYLHFYLFICTFSHVTKLHYVILLLCILLLLPVFDLIAWAIACILLLFPETIVYYCLFISFCVTFQI